MFAHQPLFEMAQVHSQRSTVGSRAPSEMNEKDVINWGLDGILDLKKEFMERTMSSMLSALRAVTSFRSRKSIRRSYHLRLR